MYIDMLQSKIHRARVTQADLHYVGSLTLDIDLIEAAEILPSQKVDVVDVNNGSRLSTYVIEGVRGSGVVGINGAAARCISPGDLVIIIAYTAIDHEAAKTHRPRIVFVDTNNSAAWVGSDPAETLDHSGLARGDVTTVGRER
nr:aspartate 1-decarboxylase [Sciscionella marina]